MEENLEIGIKENPYFFPYFNIPLSKRNQYLYMNIKNPEEEKNDGSISFSFGEKKKSDENNLNINNEDSYFKSIEATTQNDNSSNNNIERKETPQFKKNINEKKDILDNINLRINYDQIEKELNKLNNKKDNGIERNENDINKNKNNYYEINSNTQMKEELFNCSDNEEFLNKKIISNNEKIRMLQNQIKKLGQNNIINYNINRNSMGKNNKTYKDNNKNFIHDERSEKNNMNQKLFEKRLCEKVLKSNVDRVDLDIINFDNYNILCKVNREVNIFIGIKEDNNEILLQIIYDTFEIQLFNIVKDDLLVIVG